MLTVLVISQTAVLFQGTARRVIAPGEEGVFEVEALHHPIVSRLLPGNGIVDGRGRPIRRGVLQVAYNRVTAIVENIR